MKRPKRTSGRLTEKQAVTLKRIAQAGGVIVTRRAIGGDLFCLRDGSSGLPDTIVRQLINARALIAVDRGLFDGLAQSYRARRPGDS